MKEIRKLMEQAKVLGQKLWATHCKVSRNFGFIRSNDEYEMKQAIQKLNSKINDIRIELTLRKLLR